MGKLTPEQMMAYQQAAQKANEKLASTSRQQPVKIQDGAQLYRILPHWETKSPATPDAYRRYAQHWVKGTVKNGSGSNIAAVTLCARNTYGQPCPVCDAYWAAKSTPNLAKDVEELISGASAGTRYLVNALHRNSAEPNKVIVLELPYKIGTAIFGDPKTGSAGKFGECVQLIGAYPMDIEDGIDLVIRKTGSGFQTTYSVEYPSPMKSSPVDPIVLDNLVNLDEYVKAWQHTQEDEAKAIATINSLASGSSPNQALLMGGQFVQAQPAAQVYVPAQVQPQQVQPQAAQPQPQPVTYGQPFDPKEDVFTATPTPVLADGDDDDIQDLLNGLG